MNSFGREGRPSFREKERSRIEPPYPSVPGDIITNLKTHSEKKITGFFFHKPSGRKIRTVKIHEGTGLKILIFVNFSVG